MNNATLKKYARGLASFLMHFTHGGLLVTGILVTALLFARVGTAESHEQGLQEIGSFFSDRRGGSEAATTERASPTGEMRAAIDYVSRKYRVAATAVEPLVIAAVEAGERLRLDPMLIVAVMAVESGFNPIAESPMGAQGLMQVIPRFHQDKIDAVPGDNLLDPAVNIHVGALVLKEYILRTGSLEAGLQQYAGAVSDIENLYAARVLAEKQRIEAAVRRVRQSSI